MKLDKAKRDELRALEAKATRGPWETSIETDPETDKPGIMWADNGHHCIGDLYATDDSEFLAAARNALVPLLDDLDDAERRIERLERCAERVYDALLKNLDNMSQHNQDALRPAAMELLAALANEDGRKERGR